ncbi:hypothetical protein NE237_033164 [Protea cynaroides]|uniref:CCHC-type domain-containing protein n=1 Tax=Protea cynaroides TaxID=273540 RepID=A0A9Q0L4I6_9MAGN|nr:hypothetical protein NE237_033164 [Protea cynaroides]
MVKHQFRGQNFLFKQIVVHEEPVLHCFKCKSHGHRAADCPFLGNGGEENKPNTGFEMGRRSSIISNNNNLGASLGNDLGRWANVVDDEDPKNEVDYIFVTEGGGGVVGEELRDPNIMGYDLVQEIVHEAIDNTLRKEADISLDGTGLKDVEQTLTLGCLSEVQVEEGAGITAQTVTTSPGAVARIGHNGRVVITFSDVAVVDAAMTNAEGEFTKVRKRPPRGLQAMGTRRWMCCLALMLRPSRLETLHKKGYL